MSRFLHTMLRVGDLDRSVDFYTRVLGMKELRRTDVPDGKYTLAFVGYGDESSAGNAFGHLAIGVTDVAEACEKVRLAGGTVAREAGPVKFGTTIIAFVEDPDGYKIELIQRH